MQSVLCEVSYRKVQTVYLKHFNMVCREPSRGLLFHFPVKLFVFLQNDKKPKNSVFFFFFGNVKEEIILIIQAIAYVTYFFSSLKWSCRRSVSLSLRQAFLIKKRHYRRYVLQVIKGTGLWIVFISKYIYTHTCTHSHIRSVCCSNYKWTMSERRQYKWQNVTLLYLEEDSENENLNKIRNVLYNLATLFH